jgi:hypothetical protein
VIRRVQRAAWAAWLELVTIEEPPGPPEPAERLLFPGDDPPQPPQRPPCMDDDPLHDAIAAVQAIRADDVEGLAVVMQHSSHAAMVVVLAKALASLADDHGMAPCCLRAYFHEAMRRG